MNENVRKILRSEITWIISFLGFVWGAIVTVVMPIQALQLQMAQTAKDIIEIKTAQNDIPQMKTDIEVVKTKLESHINAKQPTYPQF